MLDPAVGFPYLNQIPWISLTYHRFCLFTRTSILITQSKMQLCASHTFLFLLSLLALTIPTFSQDHGEEAATEMGPVAFMWPPDRVWGAAQDNRAPCGSAQGVVNRTEFPLGALSSFSVQHACHF